jgi:hypothetical protein
MRVMTRTLVAVWCGAPLLPTARDAAYLTPTWPSFPPIDRGGFLA